MSLTGRLAALAALVALTLPGAVWAEGGSQAAPTPVRLPDGRPNWTGFWVPQDGLFDQNLGAGYVAPPPSLKEQPTELPPPKPGDPRALMKSPYRERYENLLRKELAGESAGDPTAQCFPPGMPRMMNMTYGMEILQTPKIVAITSEWGPATRRLWLDGRGHPPSDELDLTYAGDSIAHWDGDVLVVDTVGLRTEAYMNQSGLMHSDKMRLVERISSPSPGILVDEIEVTDPEVFTAPWKTVRRYHYRPDLSLKEYVCQDNNRDIEADAKPQS